ncbi:putative NBD/HSP70 family sugar kinase [Arthrobacter sp. 1088]|uniref:ROK family protein n=1 Tax=Arthrobacter sp. 1088 TaxID=2817768 RepID=UPI002866D88F|nr:ROK family protein [Arthrobacter sp. 1088]MDR6685733.1 putative NBD/HSP70 family sugar kinase [Arthrobacter sp. 1088]
MSAPTYLHPGYVLGVDLGGTKLSAGIADSSGMILAERRTPTSAGGIDVVEQIARLAEELCADIGATSDQILATGIGAAGVPDSEGNHLSQAPNLSALSNVSLGPALSERLKHPVVLENDVNISALGELHYGVGRGHSDFVFVSVGTGIGMGIIADGRLVRGSSGAAGEIGYLPMGTDALAPENHVRGPLEEVVAGDRLDARYFAASGRRLTTPEIFALATKGDAAAIEALDTESRWLAAALVAVNAVLDPEIFVIGGGIGGRKELLPFIRTWLQRHGSSLNIYTSELGQRAPLAGALQLALQAGGTASTVPVRVGASWPDTTQKGQAR